MIFRNQKSSRVQKFYYFLQQFLLQGFIKIGENKIAAEDNVKWFLREFFTDILLDEADVVSVFIREPVLIFYELKAAAFKLIGQFLQACAGIACLARPFEHVLISVCSCNLEIQRWVGGVNVMMPENFSRIGLLA